MPVQPGKRRLQPRRQRLWCPDALGNRQHAGTVITTHLGFSQPAPPVLEDVLSRNARTGPARRRRPSAGQLLATEPQQKALLISPAERPIKCNNGAGGIERAVVRVMSNALAVDSEQQTAKRRFSWSANAWPDRVSPPASYCAQSHWPLSDDADARSILKTKVHSTLWGCVTFSFQVKMSSFSRVVRHCSQPIAKTRSLRTVIRRRRVPRLAESNCSTN